MAATKSSRSRLTAPMDFPEAMVFHPTMEEFADFPGLIKMIEAKGAHQGGICKIVPPKEWVPRKVGYAPETFNHLTIEAPKKQMFTQIGDQRTFQTKCLSKAPMSIKDYYELATSSRYGTPNHTSYEDLERKYWKSLHFMPPIYGADVADTITDPEVTSMNIGHLDSILKHYEGDTGQVFAGVNSPYLYFGMWKATFSWHVEDMDFYGINFLHYGMPKTWYCVPPKYGYLMERAAAGLFPNVSSWCTNFMRHKTCLIAPQIMDDMGVPYQKVVQEERDIIIVFPYAYHSGFNHGYNIAESTNFASERWIEYGKRHRSCDCSRNQVKLDMSIFVKRFQPEKYEDWLAGRDIAPHPEDPPEVVGEIRLRAEDPEAFKKMMHTKLVLKDKPRFETFVTKEGRHVKYNKDTFKLHHASKFQDEEEKEDFEKYRRSVNRQARDGVLLDIYQHVEYNNLKVTVFPDTYKCVGEGLDLIREMLGRPNIRSVKELIDNGEMIKIKQKLFQRKVRSREDKKKKTITRKIKRTVVADIYRHVIKDIQAVVKEGTFEIIGQISDELVELLAFFPLKELVASGSMQKDHQAKVTIEELITEDVTDDERSGKKRKLFIYEHEASGLKFRVDAKNNKISGRKSDQLVEIMADRNLDECIDTGIFKFVKTIFKKSGVPKPKVFHLYQHVEHTNVTFMVNSKTGNLAGKTNQFKIALLKSKTIQDLVNDGKLLYMGEKMLLTEDKKTPKKSQILFKSFKTPNHEIVVGTNGSRVVYALPDDAELKAMIKSTTMEELIKEKKLEDSPSAVGQDKKDLVMKMLKHQMTPERISLTKWQFIDDESKILLSNDDNEILDEYKERYRSEIAGGKLADLAADSIIRMLESTLDIYKNEPLLRKSLGNCFTTAFDQIGITYENSSQVFDIFLRAQNQSFIVREEKLNWTVSAVVKDEKEDEDNEEQVQFEEMFASDPEYFGEEDVEIEESPAEMAAFEETDSDDDSDYGWVKKRKKKNMGRPSDKKKIIGPPLEKRMRGHYDQDLGLDLTGQLCLLLKTMFKKLKLDAAMGTNTQGVIPFSIDKMIREHPLLTRSTVETLIPALKGVKCVMDDGSGGYLWQGVKIDNERQLLREILDQPEEDEDLMSDMWLLCRKILRAFMYGKFSGFKLAPLTRKVFKIRKMEEAKRTRAQTAMQLLVGLNLIKKNSLQYIFNGPNVFDEWQHDLVEQYGNGLTIRQCRVDLETIKLSRSHEQVINEILGVVKMDKNQTTGQAVLFKRQAEMAEVTQKYCEGNELTPEQERSIRYRDTVCKCGTSEPIKGGSRIREKAHTGYKKRSRCKKCPGCNAPKCMMCSNCLNPHFKQSCSSRFCYFPVIPYCPCFK
eukprot:snap_masked-scaffold732_size105256-processed-gene-0.9 protein:Tk09380 transcript:snap_masked-scaffold732_size105256-processed-gene-0.9-mRNA-1 annotation:"jumonji domain containing"